MKKIKRPTLVEILVVATIVVLLAGIVPAFGNARHTVHPMKCSSVLRGKHIGEVSSTSHPEP